MNSLFGRLTLVLAGPGLAAALMAVQPVAAQTSTPAATPPSSPARSRGYIPPDRAPDIASLIGPPPAPESGSEAGDIATYRATRALQGSTRWALATRDAVYGPAAVLQDFSCALGMQLTPANSPALDRMLGRFGMDDGAAASRAKKVYRRPRPFVDHDGPICEAKSDGLIHSYSYPSGHSTYSWTVGLVLAEAAPDRAAEILARARVYGESRIVCGVHYESDVQAGRVAASAVFSTLQVQPEFQRDLASARAELAALRSAGGAPPDAEECRIEADAVAHPVW